ncbi:hypothetical protein [Streptomyces sp. NPDC058457]|uniref:hypothetical protein n=1 Tax=Streptomyces sp. NPDC058457 TaxID=3346507 RepID=UPI003650EB7E
MPLTNAERAGSDSIRPDVPPTRPALRQGAREGVERGRDHQTGAESEQQHAGEHVLETSAPDTCHSPHATASSPVPMFPATGISPAKTRA